MIAREVIGLQRRYCANRASPVFAELRAIVNKASGIPGVVRAALTSIADKLELAILYGSVAKSEAASGDIDLLLVSDVLTLEESYRVADNQNLGPSPVSFLQT